MIINSFSTWISIQGKPCKEYRVEESQGKKTATCWVASEEGKDYEVNWKATSSSTAQGPVCARIQIDGRKCGGQYIRFGPRAKTMSGMTTGPTARRRFSFEPVKTTDEDLFVTAHASPEMSEIRITIRRTMLHEASLAKTVSAPAEQIFHEVSKKGMNHRTSFKSELTEPTRVTRAEDYGEPLATFYFRYRPLEILQADGIAPAVPLPIRGVFTPTPSPTPPPPNSIELRTSGLKRPHSIPNPDEEHVETALAMDLKRQSDSTMKPPLIKLDKLVKDEEKINLGQQIVVSRTNRKPQARSPRKKIKMEEVIDLTLNN
ncbi:hypothetical protein L218DRAFT_1079593 [Marasmius fiardii PR-910]|nr:hypothetical protein L218DRAFT_1079593 [Marasmius fiardii PR-910]